MSRTINRFNCKIDRHPESSVGVLTTERGVLPLCSLDVRAQIHGLGSKSVVRQTFINCFDEPIEATYIFPLPGRDAVTKFVMQVDGRVIDGQLQEREQARATYDQAVQAGHTAAIAEEERSETFTMRVGNIPPGEKVSVEMTVVGQLAVAGDQALYRFPLVVAPRYISGRPLAGRSVGDGTAVDTDLVPDASRVTPPVLIPGKLSPVELSFEVDFHLPPEFDFASIVDGLSCSLHSVLVNDTGVTDGLPLKIRLQPGEKLNRDFILRFPYLTAQATFTLLAAPLDNQSSVFSVNIVPPVENHEAKPRDVVFVLDRSGSMSGWKMVAARRAVGRMIDTMRDEDRFSVLAFDTDIEFPQQSGPNFLHGTDRNRWDVVQWVGEIESRGGTAMESAILTALRQFESNGDDRRDPVVVLITDGQIGAEDAVLKTIKRFQNNFKPRFFCLGIDEAVNFSVLNRIARLTGGTCETVETETQLDKVMDRFHREIGNPALTEIHLSSSRGVKIEDLTANGTVNVFPGRPISLFAIAKKCQEPFEITVAGFDARGERWTRTVRSRVADGELLTALWGRERLRDLEDQYVSGNTKKSLVRKIVSVSLLAKVLSRFTAYVAVDRSRVVNEGGVVQKVVQPVEVPESRSLNEFSQAIFGSIFGRATAPASPKTRSLRMANKIGRKRRKLSKGDFNLTDMESGGGLSDVSEYADSCLREFTEPEADMFEIYDDEISRSNDPEIRFIDLLMTEADDLGASAILVYPDGPTYRIDYLVAGLRQERDDSLPPSSGTSLAKRLMGLARLSQEFGDRPQTGDWIVRGRKWAVLACPDRESQPVVLLVRSEINAGLSRVDISDPPSTQEMLEKHAWLRLILEAFCEYFNVSSGDANPQMSIKRLNNRLDWLREVAAHFSDTQSNLLLRIVGVLERKIGSFAQIHIDLIDILNEMIDYTNARIRKELES